ncbi:hypothetical protein EIP86_011608 [Pleurotus ostreatoroseus]|nr:hypothetical protein EIP86_011608 [Pleurotus ostreatoroseus]
MVSATASSAPKQPLSYADSARKAQSARNAPLQVKQRKQAQAPIASPGASAAASISNAAPVTSASKAQSASSSHDSPTVALPPPSPAERESIHNSTNGDPYSIATETTASSSSSTAVKATNPPPVNVWNVRMERMAHLQAQTQANGQSSQSRFVPQALSLMQDMDRAAELPVQAEISDVVQSLTPPQRPNGQQKDSHPELSGGPSITSAVASSIKAGKVDEAWSSRPHSLQSTPPALPHLGDTTAWPEVGKSLPTASDSLKPKGSVGEETKGEAREAGSEHATPRKSEKPKWVPIPAEEMQAAIDAQRSQQARRGGHGRSRSQHRGEGRGTAPHASTSTSTSASASVSVAPSVAGGVNSKAHSRAQSTARDRASTSRAPSLPQSQAHSRAGSVQSSPKHTARGKRLPEDNGGVMDSVITGDANRSMRSSRAASPQSQNRPYLQVSTGTNIGVPIPVVPTIPISGMNPAQLRGGSPRLPYPDGRGSPYFPPPLMGPYPPGHTNGSPAATPYPIAPGFSASPVPIPPPYAGAPPYTPYAPYHYTYGGQPYPPYWAPAGTSPDANMAYSSLPHTQPMTQLPPPAPESKRQAAGVTTGSAPSAALHPPSDTASQQNDREAPSQPQPKRSPEKGRSRVMSFGSIVVAEASTPASPAPDAAANNATETRSQAEGESSSANEPGAEAPISTASGIEPAFTKLTIGVDAKEAASKTSRRPGGSKPPQADSQGSGIAAEAADPANMGDRKWEFGTARLPEDEETKPVQPPSQSSQVAAGAKAEVAQAVPREGAVPAVGAQRSPVSPSGTIRHSAPPEQINSDPFTVKDYGYGFGRKNAVGHGGKSAEDPAMAHIPGGAPAGRPRRGSWNGANGSERGYERGFGGRGRGRGRGSRGYSGRGARGQFSVSPTIPSHRKPHMAPEYEDEAYYAAMQSPGVAYMAPGYEPYPPYPVYPPVPIPPTAYSGAPIPAPVTKVAFPLDWTRYHLLGQLEYYLGAENLAHDLFLRKKMDKRGWIPIHVLANFRRVQALTYNHQLVTDILALSSLAEVRGEWIRIHRWEQYVLPDAQESTVELSAGTGPHEEGTPSTDYPYTSGSSWLPAEGNAPHDSSTYAPSTGYPAQEYSHVPYGYYPPQGEYPAENAGHASGYVPAAPYGHLAKGHTTRAEASKDEGHTGQSDASAVLDVTVDIQEEDDENEESEELESDESDVEIVLGKDAGRSWTPERKQG